ncbi:MAG: hypothetical protein P8J93_05735 [SAR86 cluster bacterium]|jgi:hypothetical protein|nr:hypothetical protein [SAR86 cluster bacterium]
MRFMDKDKTKDSLRKELKMLKQQLSKLEDEDGLCFWTGDGEEIETLYANIKVVESKLNK